MEQDDIFNVKMVGSGTVPIKKALPDETVTYLKASDDPKNKEAPEVNSLDDLLHMCKELELLTILMQTNIRNLIKKSNGIPAEDESPKDSLGAQIPF